VTLDIAAIKVPQLLALLRARRERSACTSANQRDASRQIRTADVRFESKADMTL
jgi:hypothetical protein